MKFKNFIVQFLYLHKKAEIGKTGWQRDWGFVMLPAMLLLAGVHDLQCLFRFFD
jgi:hypothetical protein